MLSDLLEDDLAEVTYDAQIAGLSYSINTHRGGIVVSVNGYNDKLGVLAKDVLKTVKNLKVDPNRLAVMKEQVSSRLSCLKNLAIY